MLRNQDTMTKELRFTLLACIALMLAWTVGACSTDIASSSSSSGSAGGGGATATTTSGAGGAGGVTSSSNSGTIDDDGDGFSEEQGDCDDANKDVHPDAVEVCDDGIDNNCNAAIDAKEPDSDGDGFGPCAGDCDDTDKDVNPSAAEIDGDGVDNNCDGVIDADFDSDGYSVADGDCDDSDPKVNPGAEEDCFDGVDNDCNGFADAAEPDADMDGYGPCGGDCDDNNPLVGPGQKEIAGDGIDNNCDNLIDLDIDGDGWTTQNGDCNDNDPAVNPSVLENCGDMIDNNCDGKVDKDCLGKCDLAKLFASSVGCEYFAIDADNHNSYDGQPYAIVVSNVDAADTANVQVQIRQGGNWQTQQSATVTPLTLHQFQMPDRHINDTGINQAGAYRVISDIPIIAYQFQPINGQTSFTSDASLLLPTSALDKFYYVVGWGNPSYNDPQIAIVATEDNTTVKMTPSIATNGGGGVPAYTAGQQATLPVLNAGDYIQIETKAASQSGFSGTYLVSDKPIAVFSANECANIPGLPKCCCDHVEEQIYGLQTWGKSYVASRLPIRQTSGVEPNQWHIFASENNTTVTYQAHPSVTGLPNGPQTMSQGQVVYLEVGGTQANPGDFVVTADKPIFIMEYMSSQGAISSGTGDPAMTQGVPVEQYLDNYVVLVPPNWINDYLVLTKPIGSIVNLDGNAVPQNDFVQINDGINPPEWEVARVKTPDGVHKLDGSKPFGVIVVGFDSYDSYAYPGGLNQQIINPKN